jgi:hypothetical protein
MLNKDMKKNEKYISYIVQSILRKKLLPELKPNSEPMLMCIASAPILQNPLAAGKSIFFVIYYRFLKP